MYLEMGQEASSLYELKTSLASQKIQAFMYVHVFLLVWDLVEHHFTPGHWTHKRLLPSVDPEVIEEVVPFAEKLAASLVSTDEDFRYSSWVYIGKLDYQVVCRGWDMHFIHIFPNVNATTGNDLSYHLVCHLELPANIRNNLLNFFLSKACILMMAR
jgi:hypothetical protein